MARLDDLTILLTMVDKTGKAFKSVDKKLAKIQKATAAIKAAGKVMGAGLVAAFTAAALRGELLTDQLASMSRQTNLTFQESQALFLAVQDADASTNLDNLNEAILTVKERFTDAATGAGPLFGLMKDFQGFELDLGVDNARDQLANFLEQVGELPDANSKIFALKEVIGDEDARPFFNIINNTEKLNTLLKDLRTNAEDVDGVFSNFTIAGITDAKDASKDLASEWDRFAVNINAFISPTIALFTGALVWLTKKANDALDGVRGFQNYIRDITGRGIADSPVELTDDAAQRIAAIEAEKRSVESLRSVGGSSSIPTGIIKNEYGTFSNIDEFKKHQESIEKQITASIKDIRTIEQPKRVASIDLVNNSDQTDRILAANDARFEAQSGSSQNFDLKQEMLDQELSAINSITDALGSAGGAFGAFADAAGSSSSKAFKSFQYLQVALSTAAGISAQIQSLAAIDAPTISQKFAAFAKIGALVATSIASLKSIKLGGGGGSAGASASAGASTPQATAQGGTAPQETRSAGKTIIQLEGRDRTYDQTDIQNITDALRQSGADIEVLYNS